MQVQINLCCFVKIWGKIKRLTWALELVGDWTCWRKGWLLTQSVQQQSEDWALDCWALEELKLRHKGGRPITSFLSLNMSLGMRLLLFLCLDKFDNRKGVPMGAFRFEPWPHPFSLHPLLLREPLVRPTIAWVRISRTFQQRGEEWHASVALSRWVWLHGNRAQRCTECLKHELPPSHW